MMRGKGGMDGGIYTSSRDSIALSFAEFVQHELTVQVFNSRVLNYLKPEIVHHQQSAIEHGF